MVKLGIFYEQDDAEKDTGRVQVAGVDDETVYGTFDTEEEAKKEMVRLQAEFDRDDKIQVEYLEWEKECLSRHNISQEELRGYLVNVVII